MSTTEQLCSMLRQRLRDEIAKLQARCERIEGVANHMLAYLETACVKETGEHFARMLREAMEVKP